MSTWSNVGINIKFAALSSQASVEQHLLIKMMMSTMRVVAVALATTISFSICHGFTISNSRREDRVMKSLRLDMVGGSISSSSPNKPSSSMFEMLQKNDPATAFQQIFGKQGYRGEYMDGYSHAAMIERCIDDYNWSLLPRLHWKNRG